MGMMGAGDRYTSLTVSRGRFCISSEHPPFMALSLQFLKLLARIGRFNYDDTTITCT